MMKIISESTTPRNIDAPCPRKRRRKNLINNQSNEWVSMHDSLLNSNFCQISQTGHQKHNIQSRFKLDIDNTVSADSIDASCYRFRREPIQARSPASQYKLQMITYQIAGSRVWLYQTMCSSIWLHMNLQYILVCKNLRKSRRTSQIAVTLIHTLSSARLNWHLG